MATYTHTLSLSVAAPGGVIQPSSALTYSGSGHSGFLSETVTTGTTDGQINIAFTYADIKSFYLLSDQDVTIETNSGSAADDTLTVTANVPYTWQNDSPHANPFSANVTAFFVTNSSGSTATISCSVVFDATP